MALKPVLEYDFPEDLKKLSDDDLELLSYDIRDFLISNIAKTGGHLASNLGIVEITLALHKVFDIGTDKIVWDVGHQCYVHKILTGRADRFSTLRQEGGISGFPKCEENGSDVYNSGHSSTSISAAMGIANARDMKGDDFNVIAVIGDGAMTGGLAFEGLNNAGTRETDMIVILNDNEMSISESTGSISKYLNKLRASKSYQDIKKTVKGKVEKIPLLGDPLTKGIEKSKEMLRYAVAFKGIFEDMGFRYYGPVDGNDLHEMTDILAMAKDFHGPILIHAMTKKGKGYRNAELNPSKFHGIGPFDPETGEEQKKSTDPDYSKIFGDNLIKIAKNDKRVAAITAAMKDGTGLTGFSERFPERFFDVGIAEEHAVTFASGLAIEGFRPFINIYSTFMQRAYDQILMDVCMQDLPVVFMLDRAGNVGADGETHHGVFDISYLKHMPNITIMAPKDGIELGKMMKHALSLTGPAAIRFPRGKACMDDPCNDSEPDTEIPIINGKSEILTNVESNIKKATKPVHIWAVGNMVRTAYEVIDILKEKDIPVKLINARFIKPIDIDELAITYKEAGILVTMEDNVLIGGFGESVNSLITNRMLPVEEAGSKAVKPPRILNVGWPDKFIPHGDTASIMKKYGLDAKSVAKKIEKLLEMQ